MGRTGVNFHLDLTLDFHLEVTRVDVMSRDAGNWSSLFFFLSGFGGSGAGPEAEAVIAGLEDVAVVGKPIQQGGGHLGIAEHMPTPDYTQ